MKVRQIRKLTGKFVDCDQGMMSLIVLGDQEDGPYRKKT